MDIEQFALFHNKDIRLCKYASYRDAVADMEIGNVFISIRGNFYVVQSSDALSCIIAGIGKTEMTHIGIARVGSMNVVSCYLFDRTHTGFLDHLCSYFDVTPDVVAGYVYPIQSNCCVAVTANNINDNRSIVSCATTIRTIEPGYPVELASTIVPGVQKEKEKGEKEKEEKEKEKEETIESITETWIRCNEPKTSMRKRYMERYKKYIKNKHSDMKPLTKKAFTAIMNRMGFTKSSEDKWKATKPNEDSESESD